MSIENIQESISFLEETLSSNIFDFKNKDIKFKNILKYLSQDNKKQDNKKQDNKKQDNKIDGGEESDDEKSDTESTYESIESIEPSEVIEVTPINFPSDLYEVNSDESNNSVKSKYNLAYINKNSNISGSENIINIKS